MGLDKKGPHDGEGSEFDKKTERGLRNGVRQEKDRTREWDQTRTRQNQGKGYEVRQEQDRTTVSE
jgi:hypothetical protein